MHSLYHKKMKIATIAEKKYHIQETMARKMGRGHRAEKNTSAFTRKCCNYILCFENCHRVNKLSVVSYLYMEMRSFCTFDVCGLSYSSDNITAVY